MTFQVVEQFFVEPRPDEPRPTGAEGRWVVALSGGQLAGGETLVAGHRSWKVSGVHASTIPGTVGAALTGDWPVARGMELRLEGEALLLPDAARAVQHARQVCRAIFAVAQIDAFRGCNLSEADKTLLWQLTEFIDELEQAGLEREFVKHLVDTQGESDATVARGLAQKP